MLQRLRLLALPILLAALFSTPAVAAAMRVAADRPGIDRAAASEAGPAAQAALERAIADPALRAVARVDHQDARFALPTFLWATGSDGAPGRSVAAGRSTAGAAARDHLARVAPFYRLDRDDVREAALRNVHDTGRGGVIATFQQVIDGVEVFRDEMKLMLDREQGLVAVSGFLPARALLGRGAARAFALSDAEATARALADFTGAAVGAGLLRPAGEAGGGYRTYAVSTPLEGLDSERPLRVRKVWFHLPAALVPAYYVEIVAGEGAEAYVIAARDGAILFRKDLVADDAYTYRVWADAASPYVPWDGPQGTAPTPHPTGLPEFFAPTFVAPNLVTLQNGPICDERSVAPARRHRDARQQRRRLRRPQRPRRLQRRRSPRRHDRARHVRPDVRRAAVARAGATQRHGVRDAALLRQQLAARLVLRRGLRRGVGQRPGDELRPRRARGRSAAGRGAGLRRHEQREHDDAGRRRAAAHADVRLQSRRGTGRGDRARGDRGRLPGRRRGVRRPVVQPERPGGEARRGRVQQHRHARSPGRSP